MNWTYILLAVTLALIAIVIDWQKDKTSFVIAAKTNFLKYIAIVVIAGFFAGYALSLWWLRVLLVGAGVYFFWTFIVNLVKTKPKA
jgi:hypothetical protein